MTFARMMTENFTLPRPLCDSLQHLSQSHFSGRLDIQIASATPWQCFFRFGRLIYVSGGSNAQRRWRMHLNQVCPMLDWQSFTQDFPTQTADATWEYQTLCTMVKQGYLTGESAVALVRSLMAEVLFDAACSPELSFESDSQNRLDVQFTLFSVDTALESLCTRLTDWKESGFSTWPPLYYAPLLTKPAVVSLPKQLLELLNGQQTFREVAASLRLDVTEMLKILMPFIQQGAIDAVEVVDFGNRSPAIPSKAAAQQAPLIVCIDDSPACQIVENIVTKAGYRFLAIQDPLQATKVLKQAQPALILLGLITPGIDGHALCLQLRKSEPFKQLPIIVLSGNDSLIERLRAKMAGATGFCNKPIETPKDLLSLIGKHLVQKVSR
ncbi:MAG: response regulator [Anaerolineae bacterium]|nr:response regulator [Gloeobacterales cyanobacterium ES-bin-313]